MVFETGWQAEVGAPFLNVAENVDGDDSLLSSYETVGLTIPR